MTSRGPVLMGMLLFLVVPAIRSGAQQRIEPTTMVYEQPLPTPGTSLRQRLHTDPWSGEHRPFRVSEPSASKAKREQALRNILAARRRQASLSQRPFELSRNLAGNTGEESSTSKEIGDVLEAQETGHRVYVTATVEPAGEKTEIGQPTEAATTIEPSEQNSTALPILQTTGNNSRGSIEHRNSSSDNGGGTATTSSSVQHGQRVTQEGNEARRRSTVPMPESLYNYFRPVESNIPVEDMSQFLYFGQKIQPGDGQPGNSTGNNNSVEATVPTTSRRRYQSKRPATTTLVPQLEDILNEEMNIAVERRTVERNKVSKIKNAFRSSENGLYYGKSRSRDPSTIASNVIPGDTSGNSTSEPEASEDRFSSQRARGSATAHVHAETRNATAPTQIPAVSAYEPAAEGTVESEIDANDRPAGNRTMDSVLDGGGGGAEEGKGGSVIIEIAPDKTATLRSESDSAKPIDMEMYADRSERKVTRTRTAADRSGRTDSMQMEHPPGNTTESNNIETSGTREKPIVSSFSIGRETEATSTLRIVVTEEGFASVKQPEEHRNTVKPVDSREEQRVRGVASGDVPAPRSLGSTDPPVVTGSSRHPPVQQSQQQQQQHQQQHVYAYTITNVTRLLRNYTGPGPSGEEQGGGGGGGGRRGGGGGGGGGPGRGTGTAEITTGSPERRAEPPRAQPSPVVLPRAGGSSSSIEEAARTPAELSAGTTVEPATAGGASADIGGGPLVGEPPRKVGAAAVARSAEPPANRTGTFLRYPAVNKTAIRASLRWDHRSKTRTPETDTVHERRFLRKSASAVLNQRIGPAAPDRDAAPLIPSKRTVSGGLAVVPGGAAARTVKGPSFEIDTMVANNRSATPNGSIVTGDGGGGGGVSRSLTDDTESVVPDKPEGEKGPVEAGAQATSPSPPFEPKKTGEPVNDRSTTDFSERTIETTTPLPVGLAAASPPAENPSPRAKDGDASESESNVGASATDKGADNHGSGSLAVTVTEAATAAAVNETSPVKETTATTTTTTTTTTTPGAPIFPVTPRILGEPSGRVPVEKESATLDPTEPDKVESGKSLDPSEIQRMYRSKDRSTTEPPGSGSTEQPVTMAQEEGGGPSPSGERPETEGKRPSGERSPEVRARNLSDKSKEKDDVLPIMHLYNTSDIFNGSGSIESPPETEQPRVDLPLQPEEPKPLEPSSTTTTIEPSTTDSSTPTPRPSEGKENVASPKLETSSSRPSGPGRGGSSLVNGTSGGGRSRSRQRPVYYPILPDYNSSSLYPDVNRTLLDMGPVGPRDTVNMSEVISRRHDSDAIASQETVAVVSYILATLVVFPIAVGVGLILRRLILRNRKVLEESDTSSEISCRKDGLNLENGDFKTSIEKAITKLPRIQHLCHEAEKPPPPSTPESRWEFPRDKLRLQTVLGQGNFGQVWKAEADDLTGHQGTTRLVAVKTVKEGASEREKEDLVRELEIMQQLGSHPNVVTLLGCCTEQEPHYLILEYVMYGKLLAYLRDHRTRQDFYNFSEDSAALTSRDLTVFGYCVARGMEYLASKKIIHRDLAARNVLVDHNKLCKIADFGMSRFANEEGEVIETRHGRNALPIRWMAPESLIYSLFTTKTDVWSFGILMWEIVTLGSTPYPDMTAREVMRNVQNGYRLERPSHCRTELFRVISRCWHADPDRRPEFQTLRRDLAQLLEDNMNGHYVDLESFASECTD